MVYSTFEQQDSFSEEHSDLCLVQLLGTGWPPGRAPLPENPKVLALHQSSRPTHSPNPQGFGQNQAQAPLRAVPSPTHHCESAPLSPPEASSPLQTPTSTPCTPQLAGLPTPEGSFQKAHLNTPPQCEASLFSGKAPTPLPFQVPRPLRSEPWGLFSDSQRHRLPPTLSLCLCLAVASVGPPPTLPRPRPCA